MLTIDCAIEAGNWTDADKISAITSRALGAAESHLSKPLLPDSEVSLVFTNDNHVQALNAQYRDQDKPTNVLSFAANEGGGPVTPMLGDIVLAYETVKREADEQDKSFDNHLTHLIIHGFLHLLGYDHINDKEAEDMELLEKLILTSIGISDPYTAPLA